MNVEIKTQKDYEEELLVKNEVIKMLEKALDDAEQEIDLLKRTIKSQTQINQKLFKDNLELKKKNKKIDMERFPLGYNPYQE